MKLPNAPGDKKTWLVDIEVFPNYFYAAFYNGEKWKEYDHTTLAKLAEDLHNKDLVLAGFNSFAYDDLILAFIASDPVCTPQKIYETSRDLIHNKEALRDQIFAWQYADRPWAYSIDVFQLLNGKGSLKEWACKIGSPVVAETPVDFDSPLPDDKVEDVKRYCKNDVQVTKQLLVKNWDAVTRRKTLADKFQLPGRVYCMSDQAVAQHTFLTLHRHRTKQKSAVVRQAAKDSEENNRITFEMSELVSPNVSFETKGFQDFFKEYIDSDVFLHSSSWKIRCNANLDSLSLAGATFTMGVGGIHTADEPGVFEATDDEAIIDLDVASYYPSLIIQLGLFPSHMGEGFVQDMVTLREMRLKAKRSGDKTTADALKLIINSTFGKLNDTYSPLRSVPNAHRVTINGQLYLLMLIEALTTRGRSRVISANTDGVTVSCRRDDIVHLRDVCRDWQARTGMELEEVEYAKIFRRDVNNYIAISVGGKIKYKGVANQESGKGDLTIVKEACERYLLGEVPPSITIMNAVEDNEWGKFISYLSTHNGAVLEWNNTMIGKRCRWLYTTDGHPLKRHNKATEKRGPIVALVPNCNRVTVFNYATGKIKLRDMNLDVEFYEKSAWELIDSLGVK